MLAYPEYKKSRIPWIGKIPVNWQISVLKRTTRIKGRIGWQGLTSEEYRTEGQYLLVTGTDFINGKIQWHKCWYVSEDRFSEDENIQLKEHDVLVTKDGTIGKIAFVENMPLNATLNSGVFVTRPFFNSYAPKFMFWALNSDIFPEFIECSKVGTTIAHLYQKTFEKFTFPLPSVHEQKAIATYLDKTCAAVDKAIEAKQKQLEILDALRKSIIHKAVTRGLDDSVELKDSNIDFLGRVPIDWKLTKFRYEISIRNGDFISDKLDENGLHPVVGGNGFMGMTNDFNVDEEVIAIGRVGAYCGNAHLVTKQSWISDNALIVKSMHDLKYLVYVFIALDLNSEANKTAQPVITGTKIKNIRIAIPTRKEQSQIAYFLDGKLSELQHIKENIQQQISTLQQYRKSLIHECVTGKRRITEDDVQGQL